jgi:RNA polymerase sigma-70 factor (ECF subfamily)
VAYATLYINPTDLLEQPVQLIQACINGDRYSQSSLYAQYALKMFGVCMRYSKNREEAEEIMQEGFVQVFKSLHNFKYAGSFEGWIRKIMVYCAIQHYRAKPKMHSVVNIENSLAIEAGNEDIITGLQKKELLKMIQALPPAYRMIFNLYVFEGMKHREIAEQLGIAEGTSKSNFFDAKLLLQKAVTNSLKIAKSY